MAKSGDGWQHFNQQMPTWSTRSVACSVLVSSLWLCAGCGATGLDWVSETHPETASQQRMNAVFGPIPAQTEESASEPRPRLNHTVTLGAIDAAPAQAETGQGALAGPSVVVNNYNQVNVTPAFGYGGYGFSQIPGRFSPPQVTPLPSQSAASGPLPGQSWPAVADHGPSFPYSTMPASPWARTR